MKNNKLFDFFKKYPFVEYLSILALFITANIIFADKTGLLTSGYHFTDDHEIVDINFYIHQNGLLNALKFYILGDLIWRFRPFYFFLRIINTFIFGTNFYLWHLYRAVSIGIIMWLCYVLARKLKTPVLISLIFSFIYLIGTQDEIIWRLGPQENSGLFFFVLAFIFIVDYFKKKKSLYGVLASVSTILMIMCKESFLLMAPALIIFLFYLYLDNNNQNEDMNIFKQLWDFIKVYKGFIISVCTFLLLSVGEILLYTGLYESGYAGIDTSYTIGEYVRLTLNVFIRDLKDYWITLFVCAILFVYILIKKIIKKEISKQYLRVLFIGVVFAGYSMVLQAVIYGTSAMYSRYYLPCVWVLYFIILVMEKQTVNKYLHLGIAIVLLVLANSNFKKLETTLSMDAKSYARSGERTTEVLNYVGSLKDKKKDLVVGTHFTWYEHDYSSSVYLQNEKGINSVYYIDDEHEDGEYKKIYRDDNTRISTNDVDVIITDREDEYDLNSYNVHQYSNVYILENK